MTGVIRVVVGISLASSVACSDCHGGGHADGSSVIPDGSLEASTYPSPSNCAGGFCKIEPGTFTMGSRPDSWAHPPRGENEVVMTLSRAFLMQQNEVTVEDWAASGLPHQQGVNKDGTRDCAEPRCPVGNVTWFDALEFANAYSALRTLPSCYELVDCVGEAGLGRVCGDVRLQIGRASCRERVCQYV